MPGMTLEELEGRDWGEPTFGSGLVIACHRLRRKPIDEFTTKDLRIMIGQKLGLDHLMPRAIYVLENQPLAEGEHYTGDLLASVMDCHEWLRSRPDMLARVARIVQRVTEVGNDESDLASRLHAFLAKLSNWP